jgi:lipopolysaccharide transport system ATP-binding protein
MSVVISAEQISKAFYIGIKDELPDSFMGAITRLISSPIENWKRLRKLNTFGNQNESSEDVYWALRDVSFEVRDGEVLGIIGRNGAGKSTLLKVLSRITEPTRGRARIKGRVSSLLEVGTGFHPDLSGRENIYLNGTILGMTKREIDSKFDEIIDFSGVERFLDTPIKRYSSGMKVRLAFAVAAHLEPEILIIDEVLAVGDVEFQKKCMGKMQDVAQGGRTVLFVSHNMVAMKALCNRGLVLESGSVSYDGPVDGAIFKYLDQLESLGSKRFWDSQNAPADDLIRLRGVEVQNAADPSRSLFIDESTDIFIYYEILRDHPKISVSLHLHTQGVCAFVGGTSPTPHAAGMYRTRCRIPADLLNTNNYAVSVFMISNTTELRLIEREVVAFNSIECHRPSEYLGGMIGTVRPSLLWDTDPVSSISQTQPSE